ncbi:hypothetical protein NUU61_003239 [Penicillium alfredii]|uniref:Uncharacterized protein n=1 Tax=Penicillium alfredii TaxID=1506179 RepID=A0A9W9FU83_9EURO|nr:uncharacterized protein NUU61_003239 [Penicillium alfredii]KAJ5105892.1 hypothetical protein NUU61_003239 [Penicillium alfredii]
MIFNNLWLRGLEIWLTSRLLQSRIFHRMVGRVHQKVQNLRQGTPREEMGGTKLQKDESDFKQFLEYFKEELKDQMKGKPPKKL